MSFDPTQPFEVEGGGFDPSAPFEVEAPDNRTGPSKRYVNPNRGKSGARLAGEGAFKFLNDASLARRQMMNDLAGLFGADVADEKHRLEGIADARKLDPVMNTTAGQIGYGGAAMIPAMAMTATPGLQGAGGAILSGIGLGAFQPTGTGDSRLGNSALSAGASLAGYGAFNTLGRIAQPVKTGLNRAEARAVQFLKDRGVPLSVGQETGSKAAQAVERTLGDIPASAGKMAQQGEKFRDGFTRAALRTAGVNADNATPEVLGPARDRIGGTIGSIYEKHALDVNRMLPELSAITDEASRVLPDGGRQIIVQAERIIDKAANGKLDGRTAHGIWQELAKVAKQPGVSEYATRLRELLDDAVQTAARGTDDFAKLKEARSQYRNLMVISDVADTTANGRVTPAALAQRLKSNPYTKNSMRYGKGDVELAKLARAGSTVQDRFPQSGTAPRAFQQLMLPAAIGGASYAAEGDVGQAAKIAAATWALPKLGASALTNPAVRNYFAQGITQPAIRNALIAPSRAGLGSAVPAYLLAQE